VLHQNKAPTFIPTNSKKDARRVIKLRGLAKSSWGWMLARFGKSGGEVLRRGGGMAGRLVNVSKEKIASEYAVQLVNRIGYISKIVPNVMEIALHKASNAIRKNLERQYGPALRRIWPE
jgi:hypothetical protein